MPSVNPLFHKALCYICIYAKPPHVSIFYAYTPHVAICTAPF